MLVLVPPAFDPVNCPLQILPQGAYSAEYDAGKLLRDPGFSDGSHRGRPRYGFLLRGFGHVVLQFREHGLGEQSSLALGWSD